MNTFKIKVNEDYLYKLLVISTSVITGSVNFKHSMKQKPNLKAAAV